MIRAWTKGDIEAPFAVREPGQVVADLRGHFSSVHWDFESFLLISRTARIFTAVSQRRVAADTRASQHIARFYNYSGPLL